MTNFRETWVPQVNRLLAARLQRSGAGSVRPRGLPTGMAAPAVVLPLRRVHALAALG